MKITSLKITDFRNIESAHLQVDDTTSIVVLYGKNGAGKTSALEALSLFSPGRGIHRHKFETHTKHGEKAWGLHSDIASEGEAHTVGMFYEKGKRQLKIDSNKIKSQAELSKIGNILWFTPKMDRLFMDGASHRREFLDRLVFGHFHDHAGNLNRYKHHLKARSKLLKDSASNDWLTVEEEQIAHFSLKIHEARMAYLQKLKPHLEAVDLSISGTFEHFKSMGTESIQGEFEKNRTQDSLYGSSRFGPHRSNIKGILQPEGIPLTEASTGQHKRAILEILLANTRLTHKNTGEAPILLLDEMAAHLDDKTKKYFFSTLVSLKAQIWLTGTEKSMFSFLDNPQYFKVDNGFFTKE